MKNHIISKQKLSKYFELTEKALEKAKKAIIIGKEQEAKEILDMVDNYLSDARFFNTKNKIVDSFAAINYAHGWLDSGARLGIFNVKDNALFTIK